MGNSTTLTQGEWQVMRLLWQQPHTLMELVTALEESVGWSKSTVATMVRRMHEKGIISYGEHGRTKTFYPVISQEEAAASETDSLLQRAYHGSIGLLVSSMAQRNGLSGQDIEELYEILRKVKEGQHE